MKIKNLLVAARMPFVTASVFPAILAIVWCAFVAGKFNPWYALLLVIGVFLVHIMANTINDYYDWNVSDASNPNVSPFNGGSRSIIGDLVPRNLFLLIAMACSVILLCIALIFILTGRFFVLYFSLAGLLFGYFYSSPPFKMHSRGLGELFIFLAFGPVLSAAVCYVMTGVVRKEHFLVGVPAGLATAAILWINQFPDYNSDKFAGKWNLTVRLGLKASRYFYLLLIISVYIATGLLICFQIFSIWSALIIILIPGIIKATGILFNNYKNPKKLLPAQGFTVQFQMLTVLLTTAGIIIGHWI